MQSMGPWYLGSIELLVSWVWRMILVLLRGAPRVSAIMAAAAPTKKFWKKSRLRTSSETFSDRAVLVLYSDAVVDAMRLF